MEYCKCECCVCQSVCGNGLEICNKCFSKGYLCLGCMQIKDSINDKGNCIQCACSECGETLCISGVCINTNCTDDTDMILN